MSRKQKRSETAARQFQPAHRQRPEAMRIARHDDAVLRQKHQRKRTLDLQQRITQRPSQRPLPRARHQVQNHFRIARCLKNRAVSLQLAPQLDRIRQLPLCATAICPLLQATESGCAFFSAVSPAVE